MRCHRVDHFRDERWVGLHLRLGLGLALELESVEGVELMKEGLASYEPSSGRNSKKLPTRLYYDSDYDSNSDSD